MDLGEARALLGVGEDCDRATARRHYLRRARLLHPDLHDEETDDLRAEASAAMKQLNEAWDVVKASSPRTALSGTAGLEPRATVRRRPRATGDAANPATGIGQGRRSASPSAQGASGASRGQRLRGPGWPKPPALDEALVAVQAALRRKRFVGAKAITAVTSVEDASFGTWALTWLREIRSEGLVVLPGEFEPAPQQLFEGDIAQVEVHGNGLEEGEWHFYRRSTREVATCSGCQNGWVGCTSCRSSGQQSCRQQVTCPGCRGSGRQNSAQTLGTQVTCVQCGGSGRSACPRCAGSGFVRCRTCAGSGHLPCSRCRGTGRLTTIDQVKIVHHVERERVEVDAGPASESARRVKIKGLSAPTVTVYPATSQPEGLPGPVATAATSLLSPRPGELDRRLELSVQPAWRTTAIGEAGAQQVWLIGSPPQVVAEQVEARRRVAREAWLVGLLLRLLAALALAAVVLLLARTATSGHVAVALAVVVGAAAAAVLCRSYVRSHPTRAQGQ